MSTLTADPHMLPGCVSARRLQRLHIAPARSYVPFSSPAVCRYEGPPRAPLTQPVASPGCGGRFLRQTGHSG